MKFTTLIFLLLKLLYIKRFLERLDRLSMWDFDKCYIPLILERNMSISTYIVDNRIIGSELTPSHCTSPYKAFKLLTDLYKNEHTRGAIPKKFHKYLSNNDKILEKYDTDLLVGEEDIATQHILDLKLRIDKSTSKPVFLENILYSHKESVETKYGKILNAVVQLTSKEAFFILSNILANDRCFHFFEILEYKHLTSIEDIEITEDMLIYSNYQLLSDGPTIIKLNEYALEYVKSVKASLLAKTIDPYSIQHYSGTQMLSFLGYLQPVQDYFHDIKKQIIDPEKLTHNERLLFCMFLSNYPDFILEDDKRKEIMDEYYSFYLPICEKYLPKRFPFTNELDF